LLISTAARQTVKPYMSALKENRDPTQVEWRRLTTPSSEKMKSIDAGSKTDRDTFESMAEVIEATQKLDFHPLDPFVASVASGVDARSVAEPDSKDKEEFEVAVEGYYAKPVSVEMGTVHGPDAPMLVILPGIYGSTEGGFPAAFKKIAFERGMNYTILRNPLNSEMVDDEPINHPGNMQIEAEATHAILRQLQEQKPDFFDNVSLAGYSYGALLSANVAKYDEAVSPDGKRVIQGGVVALSPPQNLIHSMKQLDSLRNLYAEGAGSVTATGIHYTSEISRHGYENFMESPLATRGPGSNITETKIADAYGSRNEMKDMVAQVDRQFGHKQLPPTWPEYFKRRRVLNEMTYEQYTQEWFSKDPWLAEQGITAETLAEKTSYEEALESMTKTPVLTLVSQDDYILNSEDVETYRELASESEGLEYTRVMDHGGHVGLLFNPEVQNLIGDFAFSAEHLGAREQAS